jgi:hypothetical protein
MVLPSIGLSQAAKLCTDGAGKSLTACCDVEGRYFFSINRPS